MLDGSDEGHEQMVSQWADDRHYSIALGIPGSTYIAEVWRSSGQEWVLLSVSLDIGRSDTGLRVSYPSLEEALLAAEAIAKRLIEE
jgi:hypothetical protein